MLCKFYPIEFKAFDNFTRVGIDTGISTTLLTYLVGDFYISIARFQPTYQSISEMLVHAKFLRKCN